MAEEKILQGLSMQEIRYIYEGQPFSEVEIKPVIYQPDFFDRQIALESEVFYDLRVEHDIRPHRLDQSSASELAEIRRFFEDHGSSFFFLFNGPEVIGSILLVRNYIQCLAVARQYQRQGYGRKLTLFAVSFLLNKGFRCVEVSILPGNTPAQLLYTSIGFKEQA